MNTFLERLTYIAADKSLDAFMSSLGWGGSTKTGVRSGTMPSAANLEQLALCESVSISWLLTGVGSPYVVQWCSSPRDAGLALSAQNVHEGGWAHKVLTSKAFTVVVLMRSAETKKGAPYREIQLFSGQFPAGNAVIEPLTWLPVIDAPDVDLDDLELEQLAKGWISPHVYFRDAKLSASAPMRESAREPGSYSRRLTATQRIELHSAVDSLGTEDQLRILDLAKRLAG